MIQKTIRLYLAFSFAIKLGISFISAIYAMFLISRGLDLFEVSLVNFSFFTVLFIMEIPTGVFADSFGRKLSFILSCFLIGIGMFVYGQAHALGGFILAEVICAVGHTFLSGAFQAWFVDTLKYHGYTGTLDRVFSQEQSVANCAGILGAIAGAFLADWGSALPWIAGGGIWMMTGIAAIFLIKEEYFVHRRFSVNDCFAPLKRLPRLARNFGIRNSAVRFILLMGGFQIIVVQAPNMQWQPFFQPFLGSKTSFGFLFAAIYVSLLVGSYLAPRFLKICGSEKRALLASQIVIGIGMMISAAVGIFSFALAMFLVHEVMRGLFRPIKDAYLNDHIPSQERATLISLEATILHFGGMIGLLATGFAAQQTSIATTWIISALFLIIVTLCIARMKTDHA
ncbi:MAG: MFS transporter [bacterium]|nr:MFS transporter [bacterium]